MESSASFFEVEKTEVYREMVFTDGDTRRSAKWGSGFSRRAHRTIADTGRSH